MSVMSKVEVLRAACCIATIDGEIDQTEQDLIEQLATKAGVGQASLNAIIQRANSDDTFFKEQFEILIADPQEAMMVMFDMAIADGKITSEKRMVLHHFAQKLQVNEEEFESLLHSAESRMGGS